MDYNKPQQSQQNEQGRSQYEHTVNQDVLCQHLPDDPPTLTFENVSKQYGDVVAVQNVNFTVYPGELHCLAGPNGSGKTTMGKLAVGLTRPSAGRITGTEDNIGFGFQDPSFYPELSVRENVQVFCDIINADADGEWVQAVLETLRLTRVEHQVAENLSGGFQKKLDLAIALFDAPAYLWLDEPLTDIDDVSLSRVISLLSMYTACGGAIIVSTHNLPEFTELQPYLTVFLDGQNSETVVLDQDSMSIQEQYHALIEELGTVSA